MGFDGLWGKLVAILVVPPARPCQTAAEPPVIRVAVDVALSGDAVTGSRAVARTGARVAFARPLPQPCLEGATGPSASDVALRSTL